MAARKDTGSTPATAALTRAGITFSTHIYDHDPTAPSYGTEAAEALGLDPTEVFKTLLVDADGVLVVGVVPVVGRLDLKALAAAVGAKKVTMADPAQAARVTGYVVGGISPIGQKRTLRTVVDASVSNHDRVYVSGGRRGFDIGLSPADLLVATGGVLAEISRSRS